MKAALVAMLAAILMLLCLSIPAHAQEAPECSTASSFPLIEVCALLQGNVVVIMLNGEEVISVEVDVPPPVTLPPVTLPPDPGDEPSVREPAPVVTITKIPAPATEVVPGPTSTRTTTVRPPTTTVTATPGSGNNTLAASNLDNLPTGTVAVERAVRFGLGLLLLLMVAATLGLMAAYGMGYRHSERRQVNMLAKLKTDMFGGKHRP